MILVGKTSFMVINLGTKAQWRGSRREGGVPRSLGNGSWGKTRCL
jgi:hypothetical protein